MSYANEADELAQLEHELEILRARHALFQRHGKMLSSFSRVFVPLTAGLIFLAFGYLLFTDPVAGLCILVVVAIVFVAMYLLDDSTPYKRRWIDVVSWPSVAIYGLTANLPRSEAEAIEDMIAKREGRISELKGLNL